MIIKIVILIISLLALIFLLQIGANVWAFIFFFILLISLIGMVKAD